LAKLEIVAILLPSVEGRPNPAIFALQARRFTQCSNRAKADYQPSKVLQLLKSSSTETERMPSQTKFFRAGSRVAGSARPEPWGADLEVAIISNGK
jgi:hypothetical protein